VLSSPAVSNGVVYVGDGYGVLYAVDALTGTEMWRFKTIGFVYSSPTVSNGVVYIGSNDKNLYAIDAVRGVSTTPITTPTAVSTPGILSTPTPLLPSNSRNFNASQLYWIVFIILLNGILYEGWKAVTQ
jgi:outer membrane protein assembly factor BamB